MTVTLAWRGITWDVEIVICRVCAGQRVRARHETYGMDEKDNGALAMQLSSYLVEKGSPPAVQQSSGVIFTIRLAECTMHGTLFWWVKDPKRRRGQSPDPRDSKSRANKFKRSSFGRTLAVNLCGTG